MEDLRSSRRTAAAVKSAYGDAFGGLPKFSVPFVSKSDDYSEIFGGLASSCSIPFLDLPPAINGSDASVDYSEIFGDFSGGDFAINYEELFGDSKKRPEVSSWNGRTPEEFEFGQHAEEVSEDSPEGPSRDYVASSGKNQFSSSSNYSDDGSKHFSMSYNKTSRGSIEDVISGTAHVTHLHAVPGYSYVIDSCSLLQDVRSDNPPNMPTNDIIHNVGYNGGSTAGEKGKIVPPTSSGDRTKSCGADLKTNQKEFSTKCPASEDGPVNVKHHSRSSSNYSTSSGDIFFPDVTYLTVSDISLRTQPSRVPPPSRAPPKSVSKQGHPILKVYRNTIADPEEGSLSKPMINHQTRYSLGSSKSDGSPCFFDVEVDASSAAAASAAAMKEAMEQAQARLKSAKELMERKRDILQSRKKLGHNEAVKCDERKEDKAAKEVKSFSVETTQKILLKEDKKIKEFALDDSQKILRVAKAAPDHEEKERYAISADEDRQMMQGNGFKSSQVPYKLEEISGEWKTEKQFYELINNEKKFRIVKEAQKQEVVEKKPMTTIKVSEDKENYAKKAELTYEFERNGKLHEVNETSEREEIDENSKSCNMACKEEIREIPNTILESCIWKENGNKAEEAHDFYQRKENEKKLQPAQEPHVNGQELKNANAGEGARACGESEKNVEPSNDASKFEGVHHGEEKRKLEAAKEAYGHEDSEKELSGTYVTCVPHESEKKRKMVRKTGMQDENENEIKVTSGTCMWEEGVKVVAVEEANQYENSEKARGNGKHKLCHEENEHKLEGATSALKWEEPNRTLEACMWVENDLVSKMAQDANETEENSEKLKPAQGTMGHRENEKKINSAKAACWQDYNELKTREAQLELQRYEKKEMATQVPENSEELRALEGDHGKGEHEKVKEVHEALDSEETHNRLDAAREVCQSAVNKNLEDVQLASLFENKGNSQSPDQDATESRRTVVTENSTSDMHKTEGRESERIMEREKEKEQARKLEEEKEREREREREKEKEQARKLEEEKEREREREKDRLAVERATREAHERALAEARERAERIAVERVTAEARQRALAEAREKAEKASAEALEKSLAEKALKEAKLRAERAAVERATAEARERAVEKALAEKAAADARQRAERLNATTRDRTRKDNEAGEHYRASDKEDREIKLKPSSSDDPHDARFQSAGSSSGRQRYSDSYNHGESESPLRCKARLERHQRTVERAAKALAEKNLRDILAQRELAERNRLAESLDADVRRWSTGKEGNLRALLSTLQYILGPESGWQPIPLTDVITAAAVKKAYRKATLCVHPDKLQQRGASIQQKYICEKVFDLLKEAWNRFNSEER